MVAYFVTPVRVLVLAVVLIFAGSTASATSPTEQTQATTRTAARTKGAPAAERDDAPLDGVLIIAGIVGVVIFIAWVCSRIGDNSSHVTN